MGSVGDCYDNAMIESFWSRMQVELLDRRRWRTRLELANAIFEYIEVFHNRQQRHSVLGMLTPVEFEDRYFLVAARLPTSSGCIARRCTGPSDRGSSGRNLAVKHARRSHTKLQSSPFTHSRSMTVSRPRRRPAHQRGGPGHHTAQPSTGLKSASGPHGMGERGGESLYHLRMGRARGTGPKFSTLRRVSARACTRPGFPKWRRRNREGGIVQKKRKLPTTRGDSCLRTIRRTSPGR